MNTVKTISDDIGKQFLANRAFKRKPKHPTEPMTSWTFVCPYCGMKLFSAEQHWKKHCKSKWEYYKNVPRAAVVMKIPVSVVEREWAKL